MLGRLASSRAGSLPQGIWLNPQPIMESDSTYQLLQAIHEGFCCAIMPLDSGLEEPIEHLSFINLPDASVLAPLGLVMRKTEPRSAIAEKCFAEAKCLITTCHD
jgi:DNA-binding transcriptional LysR family regulator